MMEGNKIKKRNQKRKEREKNNKEISK